MTCQTFKEKLLQKKKPRTLHIAAAASQEEFVKNLVKNIKSDDPKAETTNGSTALSYAAATGNVNIAKAIVEKNNDLPNLPSSGEKPLYMAALFGHSHMVDYLSELPTTKVW